MKNEPNFFIDTDGTKWFPFVWESGSLNDNGIRLLKEAGIRFCYIMQKLHAEKLGKWCPVTYKQENDYVWTMSF